MCTQLSGRLRCTLHPCQWGDMVGSHIYHRPAELCDFIPNNKSPESPYSDKKSWFCQPCLFSNFFLGEDWTGCLRWRLQSYIGTYAHTSGKPVLDPPSRSQPSSLDWLPASSICSGFVGFTCHSRSPLLLHWPSLISYSCSLLLQYQSVLLPSISVSFWIELYC